MKVNHTVLLRFKKGIQEHEISQCFIDLANLQNIVWGLEKFSYGTYNSHEGLNQGFTHAFQMTFTSEKDRDSYLEHEAHKKIAGNIVAKLQDFPNDVIAFDFKFISPPPTPRTICDGIEQIIENDNSLETLRLAVGKLTEVSEQINKNPAQYKKSILMNFLNEKKNEITIMPDKILSRIDKLLEKINSQINSANKTAL